jgi:multidrug efflux pump subunit AcrA (membrane-fusion protein)
MKNNKILLVVLAFVSLLVIWVGITFYKAYQPKQIVLQGEIDAQSYNVSSKLPGRISKIFVKKGDKVEIGDAIFSIASPEVQAKLKQAQAAKELRDEFRKASNF